MRWWYGMYVLLCSNVMLDALTKPYNLRGGSRAEQPTVNTTSCGFIALIIRLQTFGVPSLITRFMGPTWGPSGADRTQVGPMLAPWTLLSGLPSHINEENSTLEFKALTYTWLDLHVDVAVKIYAVFAVCNGFTLAVYCLLDERICRCW